VLENLETQFYQEALKKFQPSDYANAGFQSSDIIIEQITIIQEDEFVHVTAIEDIIVNLGMTPMQCQYDFSSVLTDVTTMVSFAQLVENVGVGAYLGAAHLIQEPRVLTAAASIVTIESRHQSVLNLFQGLSAIPQSFDIPLLPNEVLALAGQIISGCDLGIQGVYIYSLSLSLTVVSKAAAHHRTRS
jgi:Ferritin-like domain